MLACMAFTSLRQRLKASARLSCTPMQAQRAPQRAQCIQHTAPTSQAQRSRGAVQCMVSTERLKEVMKGTRSGANA